MVNRLALLSSCAFLAGCSGGGVNIPTSPAPSSVVTTSSICPVSSVAQVRGYPIYDASSGAAALDRCTIVAYYRAGYAVVAGSDPGPLDQALGLPADSSTTTVNLPPQAAPDSVATPSGTELPDTNFTVATQRTVLALAPDGTPATLEVTDDNPQGLQTQIDGWLAQLRAGSVPESVRHTASLTGDANPDPNAWTALGSKTISTEAYAWWSPDFFSRNFSWMRAGSSTATMRLFRLNSKSNFDYYLVKTALSVNPNFQTCPALQPCYFWNAFHNVSVNLQANAAGGLTDGTLIGYEPKTVPSSVEYNVKLGGGLSAEVGANKDGPNGKVGANANAEISTKFTIPSVETVSTVTGNTAAWELRHDQNLLRLQTTTSAGVGIVTFALYEFDRKINNGPVTMRMTGKIGGSFGTFRSKFFVPEKMTHGYALNPTSENYPVPQLSVSPQFTPDAPLSLKPGQTKQIVINGGLSTDPLILQWEIFSAPPFVLLDKTAAAGNVAVNVTAQITAQVGAFDYIKINSTPATATDALRGGPLTVPVKIVSQ